MSNQSFCERSTWGRIQQPMNTLTGLAFFGTAYALHVAHGDPCLVGIMLLLAASTVAMHATGSPTAGALDMTAMVACIAYSLLGNVGCARRAARTLTLLLSFGAFASPTYVGNLRFFTALTTLWFLSYLPDATPRVLLGYAVFLASLILWIKDRDGSLCAPHAWHQAHALWHIGTAVGFCILLPIHST